MKESITVKQWLMIIVLSVISVVAIYYNASPEIYLGYFLALLGIFIIGSFSDKIVGGGLGAIIVSLGLLARKYIPQTMDLKPKALAKFQVQNSQYTEFIGRYFWLMILAGIGLGLLGALVGKMLREDAGQRFTTNRITNMALFIALAVAINTVRVGMVSFGGFPIIYSGYVLGPVAGFIVGGVADILGFIIRPAGTAFNPIFTLTSALTGLIPVLVTRLIGEKYPKLTLIKVLIGVAVGQLITSVLLVPFFSAMLYAKSGFAVLAGKALIKQALSAPLYAFLIVSISSALSKAVHLEGDRKHKASRVA